MLARNSLKKRPRAFVRTSFENENVLCSVHLKYLDRLPVAAVVRRSDETAPEIREEIVDGCRVFQQPHSLPGERFQQLLIGWCSR